MVSWDELPITDMIIVFYILSGQTYLVNTFLMPCLERLSEKYNFSETATGILVALGISIPELTTNLLSSFSFKRETIGYGFGAIVGSGAFDFTICFGAMSLFSHHYHRKPIKLKLNALLRDIYIYIVTILYLALVFWDYQISFTEAFILTLFYPSYLIYSLKHSSQQDDFDTSLEHQKHHLPTTINLQFMKKCQLYLSTDKLKHNPYQEFDLTDIQIENESLEGEQIPEEEIKQPEQEVPIAENAPEHVPIVLLPFHWLFQYTLPIQKQPELSFFMISFYCFLIVKFTISTVDEVVEVIQVGHAFVGLTVASWAGNISDTLNAIVAAKSKKTELATSSIIGSQILNLQMCLGMPWMLTILFHQQNIVFYDATIFISIIAILIVVVLSLLLMVIHQLELSYRLGVELLLLYLAYFIFEWKNNKL